MIISSGLRSVSLRGGAPSNSSGAPVTAERHLSLRQQSIADELELYDPHWAGLFVAGVALARRIDEPGNAYLLGHAGRELSRAVVRRLAYQPGHRAGVAPDVPGGLLHAVGITGTAAGDGVCERGDAFRHVIAAALELDPEYPTVDAWFRVHNQLTRISHINPLPNARSADPGDALSAFDEMTELIYGRLAPYFDTQQELDALLSVDEPSDDDVIRLHTLVERPAQRTYFFHRLARPGWFAKLSQADLLNAPSAPITQTSDGGWVWRQWPEGDFVVRMASHVPEAVTGYIRSIPPAAANPLVWRTALQAASLLPASLSRDLVPQFRRAVSGGRLTGSGDLIVHFAVALAQGGEPNQAWNLVRDLLDVELDDAASPYLRGQVHFSRIGSHEVWLLEHELFPALSAADSAGLLTWAAYALRNQLRVALPSPSEHGHREAPGAESAEVDELVATNEDVGAPLIDDVQQSSDEMCGMLYRRDLLEADVEDAEPISTLARLVARTAVALGRDGEEGLQHAVAALGRQRQTIFRRIELLVLASAGPANAHQIGVALDRITYDERVRAFWPREVAIFVRGAWAHAPRDAQERFKAVLQAPDRAAVRAGLRSIHGEEPADEEVEESVRARQCSMLQLFGSRVPDQLAAIAQAVSYDSLAPDADQLPQDNLGISILSRTGPLSPLTDEEIDALSPESVLQYLRTWQPQGDGWDSPSIDGLSYAVAHSVSRDPVRARPLIEAAISLEELSYVRGVMSGLVDAAQKGEAVPWPEALRLASGISVASDAAFSGTRPQRADRTWRDAKRLALELVDVGAQHDAVPEASLQDAWAVIDAVFENPDTAAPAQRSSQGPEQAARLTENQLVVARGALTFVSMTAAVRLAASVARLAAEPVALERSAERAGSEQDGDLIHSRLAPTEKERRTAAVPLLARIERWLSSGEPWVSSVQAAIGESLPTLVWLDRAWVTAVHESLFGGGYGHPETNPTWSTFIVRTGPWSIAFEVLRSSYVRAANALPRATTDSDRAREWHPEYALASHVLTLVVNGFAHAGEPDRLVETVFTRAQGGDLERLYGNLARGLRSHPGAPTNGIAQQLASFWSWRLQELDRMPAGFRRDREAEGLGWFFTVEGIPDGDALALLQRTVLVAERLGRIVSLWWPKLASLASRHPSEVVAVSSLIVERHVRGEFRRVRINEVIHIVRTGLASIDGGVQRTATRLAHLLGERGYDEMRLVLEEAGATPPVREH